MAAALATITHHSAQRSKTARARGGGARVEVHSRVPEDAVPPPPPQAAGAQYFAMNADEDEGMAPAAGRPAPFPEVLPQAGLGRHGGVGYELVLANAVPQLGVELDAEQHSVVRMVSLWSQGVPVDRLLQEAMSGNMDRVELEVKEEVGVQERP